MFAILLPCLLAAAGASPLSECGDWEIASASFSIAPTKSDGRPWDGAGSPPDVVVEVRERQKAPVWNFRLTKAQDSFHGVVRPKKKKKKRAIIPAPLPAAIAVNVYDADLLASDPIALLGIEQQAGGLGWVRFAGSQPPLDSIQVVAFLTSRASCSPTSKARASENDWIIEPGRLGPIWSDTTSEDLAKALGKANLANQEVDLGEGDTTLGTVLFPKSDSKKAEIVWAGGSSSGGPERVTIRGAKTAWHTAEGVTLGTTLAKLEELNGKPFDVAGYGWDYGGTVINWNGGNLEHLRSDMQGARVSLRLHPVDKAVPAALTPLARELSIGIAGDKPVSSGHPEMKKLNPAVHEIVVGF